MMSTPDVVRLLPLSTLKQSRPRKIPTCNSRDKGKGREADPALRASSRHHRNPDLRHLIAQSVRGNKPGDAHRAYDADLRDRMG